MSKARRLQPRAALGSIFASCARVDSRPPDAADRLVHDTSMTNTTRLLDRDAEEACLSASSSSSFWVRPPNWSGLSSF
jgi:hypothetical protein